MRFRTNEKTVGIQIRVPLAIRYKVATLGRKIETRNGAII